jgi:hypothetical protein
VAVLVSGAVRIWLVAVLAMVVIGGYGLASRP